MKKLTLYDAGKINTEKMYLAQVNLVPTVIYYSKMRIYDLINEIELSKNDLISNEIPFEKHLIKTSKQTDCGTITFKFDFDLYQNKLNKS